MADHTGISWTDATWNPSIGCRKVSRGCDSCYAIRDARRLEGAPHAATAAAYAGLTQIQNGRPNWTGVVRELPNRLDQPLRWTRPRRIFVNSMSDLFHESISEAFLLQVFLTMARVWRHQFQVLTKRPARMAALLKDGRFGEQVQECLWRDHRLDLTWPLANLWLGVSVEDQQTADQRIPLLLQTPAAVRFLSLEPLLGPVDLSPLIACPCGVCHLSWAIIGGESGPQARPMDLRWARHLVAACREAGVAPFVKQLGSCWAEAHGARDRKGGDPEEWDADLRVREFPVVFNRSARGE